MMCCFFFPSRRRHTRFDCDWSSDVCSSDLTGKRGEGDLLVVEFFFRRAKLFCVASQATRSAAAAAAVTMSALSARSEERRVGEEGRSRWSPDHLKKKTR